MSTDDRDTVIDARTVVTTLTTWPAASVSAFLAAQRWFAGRDREVERAAVTDAFMVSDGRPALVLAFIEVAYREGAARETYVAPLEVGDGCDDIRDASDDPRVPLELLRRMHEHESVPTLLGARIEGHGPPHDRTVTRVRRIGGEQSNSTFVVDESIALKLLRRLQPGLHPEVEMLGALVAAGFTEAPALVGWLARQSLGHAGDVAVMAIASAFVPAEGDAFTWLRGALDAVGDGRDDGGDAVRRIEGLGATVARMHSALGRATGDEVSRLSRPRSAMESRVAQMRERLRRATASEVPGVKPLRDHEGELSRAITALWDGLPENSPAIRVHGDLHLGQVLARADGSFVVIDFEGEPLRPLRERRERDAPLRDVAGMTRSFDYAVAMSARGRERGSRARLDAVGARLRSAFLDGYRREVDPSLVPDTDQAFASALAFYEIDKALYEVSYELAQRPDWVAIPVAGVLALARAQSARRG